jgi:hypothetical protein
VSKYNSKKTVVDGQTFDSKKEANRYQELVLLEKAGVIKNLSRQVKFVLIPSQRDESGKVIERECSYKADFMYYDEAGETIVEDVKGFRTKEYIIKRKLMLYQYGIRIREV